MQKYMCGFPFLIYYSHLSYFAFDISTRIDQCFNHNPLPFHKLSSLHEDLYDIILFFEDLLSTLAPNGRQCC